jgi:hypothetical protein
MADVTHVIPGEVDTEWFSSVDPDFAAELRWLAQGNKDHVPRGF